MLLNEIHESSLVIDFSKSSCKKKKHSVDNWGNLNTDYIVDYTESVLIWEHVIICDHVEACLYFGKIFASVFNSSVSVSATTYLQKI